MIYFNVRVLSIPFRFSRVITESSDYTMDTYGNEQQAFCYKNPPKIHIKRNKTKIRINSTHSVGSIVRSPKGAPFHFVKLDADENHSKLTSFAVQKSY